MRKSLRTDNPLTTMKDAPDSRASAEGTARYAQRFASRFAADFYRAGAGATVSSIGFGTYLGASDDADDAAYSAAIRHAIASGVNLLDTAINYRCQRSECALGAAIQAVLGADEARRDELVVCTKGGYIPLDDCPPPTRADYQAYVQREFIAPEIVHPSEIVGGGHSLAPRFIRYCVAKSRQNLGLRTIDLYYVHNPEQQLGSVESGELYARLESVFAMLEDAADRGEIGGYGVATWDGLRTPPNEPGHLSLERVVAAARQVGGATHRLRAVQLPINLAMSEAVRSPTQIVGNRQMTALEAASELGLMAVGSAPLMQARLTSGLPPALVEAFPALQTDAQRALAFARAVAGVSSVLVGMRQTGHIDENLDAARVGGAS
jgi:aryl-alcohol dehydrogenase-like predicted oxidoreductase